jgi:glycosyltransferase involved in cell wall biosynthesis
MTDTPATVAVITRTKDRPLLLSRALQSVTGQICKSVRWVLVNDGGARDPVDAIAIEARERGLATTVIHNEASRGMEAASNAGIRACDSEFLVIHDDDDSWDPAFLDTCVAFLRAEPHYGGVVTHSVKVEEELTADGVREIARSPFNPGLLSVYLVDIVHVNLFPPISFLYRRTALDRVGLYDESLPVLGDWEFNLRFLQYFDIGVVPRGLANYHHRAALTAAADDYGNTLYAGRSRHIEYDALIRNRMLRGDLERGALGLGFLLSFGRLQLASPSDQVAASLVRVAKRFKLDRIVKKL